eukprot:TRINITY_DN3588_c0_g1_i2.p1 TRINITY_DN3588_c0_g1~~TRINITY_DN3588_c0_g1_i2.p1  ORF type:complete len:195 (+),score=39.09 TRINITY_DN3588_c0_g1_i2:27-611(+)
MDNPIEKWVRDVFGVVGIKYPPPHLVNHYTQQLMAKTITYEQVQQDALLFAQPANQSQQPTTGDHPISDPYAPSAPSDKDREAHEEEKAKLLAQLGKAPPTKEDTKIKEYVDQLYITYTGRKGDPASTLYLIKNLTDKAYSLNQAEYFVKFSKEAKAYQKTKAQRQETERVDKVHEFVRELFRVYLKKPEQSTL